MQIGINYTATNKSYDMYVYIIKLKFIGVLNIDVHYVLNILYIAFAHKIYHNMIIITIHS